MRRRGVARILEAVFSAILIIEAVAISYFLLLPTNPAVSGSREELSKFGYSLLSSLARNNGFDRLLFKSNGELREGWESNLKVVVNSLIPPNVIFNITVYNATINNDTGFVELEKLNDEPISNVIDETTFLKAGENVEVVYVYVSYVSSRDDIQIIFISMKLAVLRGV